MRVGPFHWLVTFERAPACAEVAPFLRIPAQGRSSGICIASSRENSVASPEAIVSNG
jgi:hypothetical protein